MIKKAYKVMKNIKTALKHIYHQRWLLPYSEKRTCPKIHEDASLAAGPCSSDNITSVFIAFIYLSLTMLLITMHTHF